MTAVPLPVLLQVARDAAEHLRAFPYDPDVLAAGADGRPCGASLPEVARLSLRGALARAAHRMVKPSRATTFAWDVLRTVDELGCLPKREPKTRETALHWLARVEQEIVRTHAAENGVRLPEVADLPAGLLESRPQDAV